MTHRAMIATIISMVRKSFLLILYLKEKSSMMIMELSDFLHYFSLTSLTPQNAAAPTASTIAVTTQ